MKNTAEYVNLESMDTPPAATPWVSPAVRVDTPVLTQDAPGLNMRAKLLARLLVMAQRYRVEGNYRQATDMFWTLVNEHADTPEAEVAKNELLVLAEGYERAGNQHMARSMYEQLMDLED